MSFTEDPGPLHKGINRRDLIKKGAIAGAIVWTVPLIESVPAYAATGSVGTCSYVTVVYTVTTGGVTTTYADKVLSNGSCAGNATSSDVTWCYTCGGHAYDNVGATNSIRQDGVTLSGSGCAAGYFTVSGGVVTPANSNVQILFAVAHDGSLDQTTGTAPNQYVIPKGGGAGSCTATVQATKINLVCGSNSVSFKCNVPAS